MTANELDLDGWKRQLELNSGYAKVTELAQNDAAFSATVSAPMRPAEVEGWLSRLQAGGANRLTESSETQKPGGRVNVSVRVERPRNS
ncbi:hypothetical protein L3Q65_00940 (plasmid) [Amycolatopsis sp. FU40]|uniref:hypothetical protein n=1 Tax=Amycolatopsis sp. FU40 TaxID=2914159 RepID=UPI001F34C0AD|nr:hypothetical protein [Amycolatopsis sp. FU40]UKD50891.1 hypothetical protein L3Q65_00940 [Amycolatopsis sp. FU40]